MEVSSRNHRMTDTYCWGAVWIRLFSMGSCDFHIVPVWQSDRIVGCFMQSILEVQVAYGMEKWSKYLPGQWLSNCLFLKDTVTLLLQLSSKTNIISPKITSLFCSIINKPGFKILIIIFSLITFCFIVVFKSLQFLRRLYWHRKSLLDVRRVHHLTVKWKETQHLQIFLESLWWGKSFL